ncbi:MAG TPA: rod shape-determining protein RodA [Cyanobacteria bacterium UBA8530]|nr:rod shape-determining protein RodA [Cyanobacteria bacterium UBA8530]
MTKGRIWRAFDWPLLGGTLVVLAFGLVAIHSATHGSSGQADFGRQVLNLLPATLLMALILFLSYQWLARSAYFVYGITVLLLLIVLFAGHSSLGAQRWINLGFMTMQPSEYAKLGLIVILAKLLSEKNIQSPEGFLQSLFVLAIPAALVFKQPDLGTTLVFGAITLGMFYWAGLPVSSIFKLMSPFLSLLLRLIGLPYWLFFVVALGGWLIWSRRQHWGVPITIWLGNLGAGLMGPHFVGLLKEYQKKRLTIFLNPESDPLGAGYHIIQSKIAIGSGGFWGKGLFHGTQTQLHFIPEQHTDFIFSVIGEELGFIGCAFVILAFLVIVLRGIRIAENASDRFGSLLAIGISSMLLFHVLVNVGMATGIMPVTGIPLPLMSYGGSALMTNLAAIGLLESIAMRQRKIFF